MNRDQNLLFGIFAVQLKKISPTQLVDEAGAWATDPAKDLPERLVASGALTEKDRNFIDRLVAEAIEAYHGDAHATLASVGGEEQVNQTFRGSILLTKEGGVHRFMPEQQVLGILDHESAFGLEESPGRYTHSSEYARGGMGRVLLVHDAYLGRDIALKELLPVFTPSSGSDVPTPMRLSMSFMARFLQEARITGQLEHPAIVPVYEVGRRNDGALYYTMKLVRGKTMSAAIRAEETLEGRLKLLPHFVDLCQAIAYAHSRGVIHRDIKPGNVMVGEFGETVVLDWGLAKAKDRQDVHADGMAETLRAMSLGGQDEITKTAYGQALGTPAYMPPEQARGRINEIDERSDVYSLGALLYELLTGKTPFTGATIDKMLKAAIEETPPLIESIAPGAPPELAAICRRAMQKEPKDRYQSARELADEIERFQSGALVQAHHYTFGQHLKRWAKKNKIFLATAAAALVILLGVGVYSYVSIYQALTETEKARNEAESARKESETARTEAEKALDISESASYRTSLMMASSQIGSGQYEDAREALWSTAESKRGWEWGYLLDQAYPEQLMLSGHEGNVLSANYSPDGKRIVTVSEDRTAKVWDAKTGKELLAFKGHADGLTSAEFSPDGNRLLIVSKDGTAKVWDANSGQQVSSLGGEGLSLSEAVWSPDGKRIGTADKKEGAQLWDAESGAKISVMTGQLGAMRSIRFSQDGNRCLALCADNSIRVWNSQNESVVTFPVQDQAIESANFALNGELILIELRYKIILWDCAQSKEILELGSVSAYQNLSAAVSMDGKHAAVLDGGNGLNGNNGALSVWDLSSQKLIDRIRVNTEYSRITFSPDGRKIVITYDYNRQILCYDIGNLHGGATRVPDRWEYWDSQNAISPDGGWSANWVRNRVLLRRVPTADDAETQFIPIVRGDHGYQVFFAKKSCRALATYLFFRHAVVMNPVNGMSYSQLTLPNGTGLSTLSGDGTRAASTMSVSSEETEIFVWETTRGHILHSSVKPRRDVRCMTLDLEGTSLVIAGEDKNVNVWNASNGAKIATLAGHTGTINRVSFSRDGTRLISASDDGTAKIWDCTANQLVATLDAQAGAVLSAQFSSDDRRIVTAHQGQVVLWDADADQQRIVLRGTGNADWPVFTPDGSRIIIGNQIWDSETGLRIGELGFKPETAFDPAGRGIWQWDTLEYVAPWRVDDLPGDKTMTWEERYDLYRRDRFERQTKKSPVSSTQYMTILVAQPRICAALDALKKAADHPAAQSPVAENAETNGFRISDDAASEALDPLTLEFSDEITSVNGTKITSVNDIVTAMNGYLKARESEPSLPMTWEITRGERPHILTFVVRDVKTERLDKTVTRGLIQGLVSFVLRLDSGKDQETQTNRDLKANGGTVVGGLPDEILNLLGLENGDVITGYNDISFDTAANLARGFQAFAKDSESNAVTQMRFDVKRGEFRRLQLTLSLQ